MSNRNARPKGGNLEKKLNGWDAAIGHAKERIRQLKLSIQVYQTRRDKGERWPGAVQDLDGRRANG